MRILYGAGSYSGSNIRLGRFLKRCPRRHEVRVAAYVRNHQYLPYIDWALDAVRTTRPNPKARVTDLFGDYDGNFPRVNLDRFSEMLAELTEWDPQLVISDAEPITAHVANAFCAELWTCSPLHMLDGVEWEMGHLNRSAVIDKARRQLATLPPATKRLVYSPFADLALRPILKDGFEWVSPYISPAFEEGWVASQRTEQPGFKFLSRAFAPKRKWALTTGETCFVVDAFYRQQVIAVSPHSGDAESVLNAALCEYFGIGRNLGEIGKDISRANDQLILFKSSEFGSDFLSKQNWGKLHEKIQ
jgi:hypothetical protein